MAFAGTYALRREMWYARAMTRPLPLAMVGRALTALWLSSLIACSFGAAKREMAGGATASDKEILDRNAPPPRAAYVEDFIVDEGAIKPASGLISDASAGVGEVAKERPHLLGGGGLLGGGNGGILERRASSDTPTSEQVVTTLATSLTEALNQQNLGFPVERIAAGTPLPSSGWVITGRIVSVDPGNRAERAVVGFGAGAATAEVQVTVERLGVGTRTPLLTFGTQADSGKMPGAAVTMNPYVAAAKFVLGKQATTRDVQALGQEIAKQIADYARERGVAPAQP